MTRRRFFLIAAIVGLFAHDGRSQVHMSAATVPFTDSRGVQWTPNTCTGWRAFPNPGTFAHPIYNTTAYTATSGVPITCLFHLQDGSYRILVHLIEAVRTFKAPQLRVFDLYVNSDPALTNIDTFARAGAVEAPVDLVAIASAVNGAITVQFLQQTPAKSSAMFAGIEILPVSPVDVFGESPLIGIPNGRLALAHSPLPGTLRLYLNGVRQTADAATVSGNALILAFATSPDDTILVDYRY